MSLLDSFNPAAAIGGLIDRNWAKRDSADQAQANERGAERAMDFSSAEAIANRDWQEKMSNTSWQRGTADMMAAGINPMLSYMKGGATTPGGGQGASSPAQGAQTRGTDSVMANMATAAQIENVQAQTKKIEAETPNIRNQMRVQDATVENLQAQTNQLRKQGDLTEAQIQQIEQAIENMKREWENLGIRGVQMTEETVLTGLRQALTKVDIKDMTVRMVLSLLDIPKAVNEANAQQTAWMKHVSPFLGDAGKVLGSANQVRDAFRKRQTGSSEISDTMTPQGIRRTTTTREHHYGN